MSTRTTTGRSPVGRRRKRPQPAPSPSISSKGGSWKAITFHQLEKWRTDNDFSQSAACRIWGVSVGYYQMWKKGEYVPSISIQKRIKKILNAKTPPPDPKTPKAKKAKTSSKPSGKPPATLGDDPSTLEVVAALKTTLGIVQHRIEFGGAIEDNDLVNFTGRIQQALLGDFDF